MVNASGTYTLYVTLNDALGNCTETATTEVTVLNALQACTTATATLNCYSPNVPLQGFSNLSPSATYQWAAGAGGNTSTVR